MGGGKRNYRAMRAKHRQWRKEEKPIKEEKKEVSKEEKEKFIALWQNIKNKSKKENENNT